MTQIYRIDKQEWTEEEADNLVNEWGMHNISYEQMVNYENITLDEAATLHQFGPRNGIYQFAALYRKNGHNFLWRGRRVPTIVRSRIVQMLLSNQADYQKQGTMLLYKAGGNSRYNNQKFYPIRLSDNRYSFLLGSVSGIQNWVSHKYPSTSNMENFEMLYSLWEREHLVDPYTTTPRRAQMSFVMDQLMSNAEYKEYYNEFVENSDVKRATYCLWKDGEIKEWERCGDNLHPKI